jgi:cytochrome b6-f complex iron-sulfur subunit
MSELNENPEKALTPEKENNKALSRRDFIKKSAMGIVVGGAALTTLNLEAFANTPAAQAIKITADEITVKLSENASLSKTGGTVKINDEIMLIRKSDTEFIAVRTICTHKGCDVELEGTKFICPCHGSEFSLDGKVLSPPAKTDLKIFETVFDSDKGTVVIKTTKAD